MIFNDIARNRAIPISVKPFAAPIDMTPVVEIIESLKPLLRHILVRVAQTPPAQPAARPQRNRNQQEQPAQPAEHVPRIPSEVVRGLPGYRVPEPLHIDPNYIMGQ